MQLQLVSSGKGSMQTADDQMEEGKRVDRNLSEKLKQSGQIFQERLLSV